MTHHITFTVRGGPVRLTFTSGRILAAISHDFDPDTGDPFAQVELRSSAAPEGAPPLTVYADNLDNVRTLLDRVSEADGDIVLQRAEHPVWMTSWRSGPYDLWLDTTFRIESKHDGTFALRFLVSDVADLRKVLDWAEPLLRAEDERRQALLDRILPR